MSKSIKPSRINPFDLNTLANKAMKDKLPNIADKRSLDIFSAGGKNTTVYVRQTDFKYKKK